MKKRWYYYATGTLLLTLLAVGIWGIDQQREKNRLLIRQENTMQQAFYELTSELQQLELTLSKALVSSSPDQNRQILANLWREANAAQQNLAKLPLSREPLVNTQKYLNQLGDFSFSLLRNDEKELENHTNKINSLLNRTRLLTDQMQRLEAALAGEKYPWTKLLANDEQDFSSATKELTSVDFSQIEQEMQNYPQLIYDGPFSDENITRKPKNLTGPRISSDQAVNVAKNFFNLRGEGVQFEVTDIEGQIKKLAEDLKDPDAKKRLRDQLKNGGPPVQTYLVRAIHANRETGTQSYISITKKEGRVMWMVNTRSVKGEKISLQQAQERAEQFLKNRGMTNFIPTGILKIYNQAVVSFAGLENDVVVYPDLIKIKVALDNGEVIGYEAQNYIYSNHERDIKQERLTMEKAQEALKDEITVVRSRKAIIPLPGGKEVLTYEFYCKLDDMDYLIYVNVDTGEIERILRYIKSETGVLTI